jgi:hypothetical protein
MRGSWQGATMGETEPALRNWNICVSEKLPGQYNDLKNAILYADYVYWLAPDLFPISEEEAARYGRDLESWKPPLLHDINQAGAGSVVIPILELSDVLKGAAGLPKFINRIKETLESSRCYVGSLVTGGREWNTYSGVTHLQWALSDLLLPDFQDLPFGAIVELRESCGDVLNPMRAELLRLTEILREIVEHYKDDGATIESEARNLIATRVEPIVREADQRTRELADRKWRKLYTGAAKAFGFAGASFFDPKLIGKAIQQTLETGALMLKDEEDKNPHPKITAQFALQAHSFLKGK